VLDHDRAGARSACARRSPSERNAGRRLERAGLEMITSIFSESSAPTRSPSVDAQTGCPRHSTVVAQDGRPPACRGGHQTQQPSSRRIRGDQRTRCWRTPRRENGRKSADPCPHLIRMPFPRQSRKPAARGTRAVRRKTSVDSQCVRERIQSLALGAALARKRLLYLPENASLHGLRAATSCAR